jgi:hypothetical protein
MVSCVCIDVEFMQRFPHCVAIGNGANTYIEQPIYLDSLGALLLRV